ncbi:MAG: hypothetical protein IJI49_02325 [Bacilli bacterium]|nr:hypothetical protein [Bacilli bacterium]
MKKIFGGIDLSWKKVIIGAVLVGVYTALVAIIPFLKYTSFHTIAVSFEAWILLGIIIIMNSKSNKDASLKCFVFFLISQPLIYLLQVPFSHLGWQLFSYYKYWFIWTILCLPMGYIGYYMKKDKWWGYLILLPMILLTLYSYYTYLSDFMFSYPKYLLICLFCIGVLIIYPLCIFNNKNIRLFGLLVSIILIVIITIIDIMNPPIYSTTIMGNSDKYTFDDSYKVYFTDKKYGKADIVYIDSVEDYMINVEFKKDGKTTMVIESPTGEKKKYHLSIKRDTYKLKEIK